MRHHKQMEPKKIEVRFESSQDQFINSCLAKGDFSSVDDLLSCAVGMLQELPEQEYEKLIRLRHMIQEAMLSFERGEYSSYTVDTLHELFDEINARNLSRQSP